MSKELKITKEKVLEASEKCEQAKEVLKAMFPEAFEEKLTEITKEIKWEWEAISNGHCFLNGMYREKQIFYVSGQHKGIQILDSLAEEYEIKTNEDLFHIYRKG